MKKIDRLALKNFKAFRDQTFEFGGKNVLLYGNNGSGKSSLYWALYTFLQSSGKTNAQLQAYFQHFDEQNPDTFRSLKNVFAPTDQDVLVEMTYVEADDTKTIKTISPALINTIGDAVLQKANLASDFINYKLLQNFYNVTHKQEVNLWHQCAPVMRCISQEYTIRNNRIGCKVKNCATSTNYRGCAIIS